jgi:hypothetical protein
VQSARELHELQREVGGAIMASLTPRWRMQKTARPVAEAFITPNDRLTAFQRLEIYNRQYWFRVLDCFYDDYPGLRAVIGERRFARLARAYLARCPSESFSLRNLGRRLEAFMRKQPRWTAPYQRPALDMARLEWAHIVAFDEGAKPGLDVDDLLGADPAKVRLALQPYITLLEVSHPVDDWLLAVKRKDDSLRAEASNAVELRHRRARHINVRGRKPRPLYIVVHRMGFMVYYKSLEREPFKILRALQQGATLEKACSVMLCNRKRSAEESSRLLQQWFEDWASYGWFCRR